ncbi:hypothetical protein SLEP1_g36473 [Rubroshorea leprosula]|uniref:Uncharacterized protein n=1 Tax=Rubroshorea leprosula TaxID=152421 RepID=A0AAV5KRS2_9ROSI|nr:hypothetical protein SLEP1_g36473 [Rubroshorea leprosula]
MKGLRRESMRKERCSRVMTMMKMKFTKKNLMMMSSNDC